MTVNTDATAVTTNGNAHPMPFDELTVDTSVSTIGLDESPSTTQSESANETAAATGGVTTTDEVASDASVRARFDDMKARALPYAQQILECLDGAYNLQGFLAGNGEFKMRNPRREDKNPGSFACNIDTGFWADFGRTKDGKPEHSGGDIISLAAHIMDIRNSEALQWVKEFITKANGGTLPPPIGEPGKRKEPDVTCSPIPDDVELPSRLTDSGNQYWVYPTPDGKRDFVVERRDTVTSKGEQSKDFYTYVWGLHEDETTPRFHTSGYSNYGPFIYGLDQLAAAPDAKVIIVEGEKTCEALRSIITKPNIVVVTSKGGASNAGNIDWSPLAGRTVIIFPDNDAAGIGYADTVGNALLGRASEVKIVDCKAIASMTKDGEPREPIVGWDVADAILDEGWEPNAVVRAIVHHTRPFDPEASASAVAALVGTAPKTLFFMPATICSLNSNGGYDDIVGGVYRDSDLIKALNLRFHPVRRGGGVWYHLLTPSSKIEAVTEDYLALAMANVFAEIKLDPSASATKKSTKKKAATINPDGDEFEYKPALQFWKSHSQRNQIKIPVFKARGEPVEHNEFNDWMGYGVEPVKGTDKAEKLIKHIYEIICRSNEAKFAYLMDWCAFLVQFPDLPAEVIVALVSEAEGSGKTTLTQALHRIMGGHAMICDSAEMLTGQFTEHLIHCSFLQCEEAFFAGDHKSMDALKSRTTSHVLQINGKYKTAFQGPSHLHIMVTTNHGQVAKLGKKARRWVIFDVDESRAGDSKYFANIYKDLDAGGYGQFLNLLMERDIKGKHPRNIIRTDELAEQQLKSAPALVQWLLDAIEMGGVPHWGSMGPTSKPEILPFDKEYTNGELYESYINWRKYTSASERALANNVFAKELKKVLGEDAYRQHVRRMDANKKSVDHGKGFLVPGGDALSEAIDTFLGIEREPGAQAQ
jgi:5S rRNA maturation endonuclease (ribonuclease M5)